MLPALRRVAPRITKTAVGTRALSKGTMDMRGSLLSNPKLGIIRLDYDYVAAPGDIDHPASFPYEVLYRVVPGLSFEMAQAGTDGSKGGMTPGSVVEGRFKEAITYLEEQGVNGITGDCGFMMNFQPLVRTITKLPVYMSSLCQLPAVTCAYGQKEKIAIFTANGTSLDPMRHLIRDECGVDTQGERYIIVGCEGVEHFGPEVAAGDKVDTEKATPGIVKLAKETQYQHPNVRAFLFECTELPQFSDAVRAATGLPVYDSITMSDSFMAGVTDNKLFGKNEWQGEWDGKQQDYKFGDNLTEAEKAQLEYKK